MIALISPSASSPGPGRRLDPELEMAMIAAGFVPAMTFYVCPPAGPGNVVQPQTEPSGFRPTIILSILP